MLGELPSEGSKAVAIGWFLGELWVTGESIWTHIKRSAWQGSLIIPAWIDRQMVP